MVVALLQNDPSFRTFLLYNRMALNDDIRNTVVRGTGGGFSAKFRVGGCRPQFENVTVG